LRTLELGTFQISNGQFTKVNAEPLPLAFFTDLAEGR
jgi:hypothetical protein